MAQLQAVSKRSFVAELSHFAILEFAGEDAAVFLQGQLSCDVEPLKTGKTGSFGAYCTPKGRVLANFFLWCQAGVWRMMLPRSVAASVQKRLAMYVLRAKVRISDRPDLALLGVGGAGAREILAGAVGVVPMGAREIHTTGASAVLALTGRRWLLALEQTRQAEWIPALTGKLDTVGALAWDWTDVHLGIPWVTASTQDQFIPQMLDLESIGGVSFKKGCYPGQEVVARTQYLGKLKRTLHLAQVDATAEPGNDLYSDDVHGQSNGMVVNVAPSLEDGSDMLVVIQSESAEKSRVCLGSPGGPVIRFLPFPRASA